MKAGISRPHFDEALAALGLTGRQFLVLTFVGRTRGSPSRSSAGGSASTRRSSSGSSTRSRSAGSRAHARPGRPSAPHARLTASGTALYEEAVAAAGAAEAAFLAPLSEAQREQLHRALLAVMTPGSPGWARERAKRARPAERAPARRTATRVRGRSPGVEMSTERSMRIGLVCPYSLTVPGGVQAQVLGLARDLRRQGHEARVLGPCDGPPPEPCVTPLGNSLPTAANGSIAPLAPDASAALRTIRALNDESFDVVHVHEPMVPGPPRRQCSSSRRRSSARSTPPAARRATRSSTGS